MSGGEKDTEFDKMVGTALGTLLIKQEELKIKIIRSRKKKK